MATETSLPIPTAPHLSTSKIDVGKALKLRLQGNTFEEIGAIFDCTASAVHQALKKFEQFCKGLESGLLTAYSEHRADLFGAVEMHLTASLLDEGAMAKASLNNRAYAFKQIHEARRLEMGQSTENVSLLARIIEQAEGRISQPIDNTDGQTPNSGLRQAKKAK